MENSIDINNDNSTNKAPERPEFLKIICILSFVACGLWILLCSLGTIALTLDEASIDKVWAQIEQSDSQFEDLDPIKFIHGFGVLCVYMLFANIFSLIGVIMMWRLEKIGFFLYAIAELSTHFFKPDMGLEQEQSYGGLIFGILIDLVFIGMYFVNLKHMNKKNNNTFIQSGS